MRSSWIRVDPDSSDKYPLKRIYRHREGEKTQTHRWWWCEDEADTGEWSIKPRNTWSHQNLEKVRKDYLLETLEGMQPCWHMDFSHLASRTEKEYISVVFDSPNL